MHCQDYDFLDLGETIARRELFRRMGTGITGIALASLLARRRISAVRRQPTRRSEHHAKEPHFPPKATSVIQLFQHGGPSHMDLLDPKPELNKQDGKPMPKYFTDLVKISRHGNLLGTPFKFKPAGQCGVEYSEILPHTSRCRRRYRRRSFDVHRTQ